LKQIATMQITTTYIFCVCTNKLQIEEKSALPLIEQVLIFWAIAALL